MSQRDSPRARHDAVTLASAMGVSQAQVTKVEHQADVYVSTRRRFVEAMGVSWNLSPGFRMESRSA